MVKPITPFSAIPVYGESCFNIKKPMHVQNATDIDASVAMNKPLSLNRRNFASSGCSFSLLFISTLYLSVSAKALRFIYGKP
jgi:hypothetical protein